MGHLSLLAVGVIAVGAGACSRQSLPVAPSTAAPAVQMSVDDEPSPGSSGFRASGVVGTPTIRAGGPGKTLDPPDQRTFSFNALAGPGGQTGHAQLDDRIGGARSNFELDCVRYFEEYNLLLLGGVVTNTSEGAPPVGQRAVMAVRDNGEGAGAGPDEITGVGPVPQVFPECRDADPGFVAFVASALQPIAQGNIQVHVSQ